MPSGSAQNSPSSIRSVSASYEDRSGLTPKEIVAELNRHVVGQPEAKRALAVALRNRWRRQKLTSDLKNEIARKNVLMIGPTGCGKTELCRRIAKLCNAPFIRTEATKYTETGFHGRDVDQIIRDLLDVAIQQAKSRMREAMRPEVKCRINDVILRILVGEATSESTRQTFRRLLAEGALEEREIEVEVPESSLHGVGGTSGGDGMSQAIGNIFGNMGGAGAGPGGPQGGAIFVQNLLSGLGVRKVRQKMTIAAARPVLESVELDKMLNQETIVKEAIRSTEQDGIVFFDEIDKICTRAEHRDGHDASAEGVQRDLLPLIEGTSVSTKYGNVQTDHILFIASGAFHHVKPSDMLAELQGRLPIRVELKALSEEDLNRILVEPENNLVRQQIELLRTEGVELKFTDSAVKEIARCAAEVNSSVENIGARRLTTIMERILEDVSFDAPELAGQNVVIDQDAVRTKVGDMLLKTDLSKFVL